MIKSPRSELAATMVEYVLLVALIALIALVAIRQVGTSTKDEFYKVQQNLN